MKKIYQTPEVTIMMVQSSPILAGSPGHGGTTDKTDNNLSRGVSWEDDDY
jgi:hypothetical protein